MNDVTISLLALFFLIGFSLTAYIAYEAFTAWLIFKATEDYDDKNKL